METSFISQKPIPEGEEVQGKDIREGIFKLIQSENPGFHEKTFISLYELNRYRRLYLASLIQMEKGELADIDRDVMEAISNNSILSENIQEVMDDTLTTGQRVADKVASFGGSWAFILSFFFLSGTVDYCELIHPQYPAFRSIPIYFTEPDSVMPRCHSGSDNYDESKQAGTKRQATGGA